MHEACFLDLVHAMCCKMSGHHLDVWAMTGVWTTLSMAHD